MPRRKMAAPETEILASPVEPAPPMEPERPPALTIVVQSWMTPIVGLAMLVLGLAGGFLLRPVGNLFLNLAPTPTAGPTAAATGNVSAARQAFMNTLIAQTRHFRGSPNAPVTMIEFADFQCPYCGRHALGTQKLIESQYVETGQVRFGYWHMAFLGQESVWAAAASECANDQNAFWKYHDKLFASQNGENQGAFNKDNLKRFAVELDLDARAFAECVDSGKYEQQVIDDTQAAHQVGWSSTPSFVINGQGLVGAQNFTAFQSVIEQALQQ